MYMHVPYVFTSVLAEKGKIGFPLPTIEGTSLTNPSIEYGQVGTCNNYLCIRLNVHISAFNSVCTKFSEFLLIRHNF